MRAFFILLAAAALPACSPQACDPSQAGFLSGIGCEASGSYGVRHDAQVSALAQQNSLALQNQADAQYQGARASQAMLSRDQARARLGAINQQTAAIAQRIAAARARGGVDQARLNAAQADLDGLRAQANGMQGGATEQQMRAAEERRRRLNDQLSGI